MALPIKPTPKLNEEESKKFLEELSCNEGRDDSFTIESIKQKSIELEKRILENESR